MWVAVNKRENNGLKPMDAEQLRENAHKMVDFIADYYKTIENFPVLSQVQVTNLLYHPSLTCIVAFLKCYPIVFVRLKITWQLL